MELIVFDLDGTLLDSSSSISNYTRETLQRLNANNIAYTVATGRTIHSARNIIAGHNFKLPHIYTNGAIIWHPEENDIELNNFLRVSETQHVLETALKHTIAPFVFIVDMNGKHLVYYQNKLNQSEVNLLNEFKSRPDLHIDHIQNICQTSRITNISLLGPAKKIDTIKVDIANEPHLIAYSGDAWEGMGFKWMDIHHHSASKGNAIIKLKEQLGVDKIICFGDSDNDLSMFELADESYAPDNANSLIKASATEVIGHHDQDGIAHFLRKRFHL